ncbi:MAG: hypothetical protein ACRC6D_14925 [Aeromonas sp.]
MTVKDPNKWIPAYEPVSQSAKQCGRLGIANHGKTTYGIIKNFLGVQRELAIATHHASTINDILYSATRERGDNVSFTGDTCGKTYGGQSTRTLPRR